MTFSTWDASFASIPWCSSSKQVRAVREAAARSSVFYVCVCVCVCFSVEGKIAYERYLVCLHVQNTALPRTLPVVK